MNQYFKFLMIGYVAIVVQGAAVNIQPSTESSQGKSISDISPEFGLIQKVYDDCQGTDDFVTCLKGKALNGLSRAIEQDSVQIFDGVVLVKQNETTEDDIPGLNDPRTLNDFSGIDRALIQKFGELLKTHFVRVDMNEARGSGDKKNGHTKYIIAALLTAMGIAGPLGLKALAMIAGKALVISKVALTIAGIIALKKIFSSDHHEETSFQVHAGDHNRRNAYVVRPAKATTAAVDPYRYYYDQHYAATV
uniref:CSON014190 protein n=1 Tax=Culicoides sonorensis TaxID=179676 RepID=A0A336MM74_CULSO